MKRRTILIIDTDGGVDDALCIALASQTNLYQEIIITTSYGNVSLRQSNVNLSIILNLLSSDIKVFSGASCALDGKIPNASYVHGDDGLGGFTSKHLDYEAEISNIDNLFSYLVAPDLSIDILGIGPATNISHILDNVSHSLINKITLMSGVVFDVGNITKYAEFNAYCDPLALEKVLSSNLPITLVPLDICRKIILPSNTSFQKFGKLEELLTVSHEFYMSRYKKWEHINGCFPHDTIALLVCLNHDKFKFYSMDIEVEFSEEKRGHIDIQLNDNSNIEVALGGDLSWVRQKIDFS